MSLHTHQSDLHEIYFCTVTCYKWLPLIEEANTYYSVYRWFHHLKHDGCFVLAYVIMPNHFHVLLYPTHTGTSLDKLVGDGKRFMAYDIVNSLKKQGKESILAILRDGVDKHEKLKGKLHQVFQLSFDARKCHDMKLLEQKMDYIHHNPVKGKWSLAGDFAMYQHSSASYYECGQHKEFEVMDYRDL
jgi:hypothetical protein